ncbi:MAG: VOC family protein [Candidatus Marinimicrobia bacterium]|nr:VOC family protein [Candidatus Neomarinimicrobiota bacterium]MCF7902278.1 VOC family protein [Candidatus Neomarinimicrobiota bacterium]
MSVPHTIVWFEIPVKDFSRAQKFYAKILNGEVVEVQMGNERMGFLPRGENGVSGAIIETEGLQPGKDGTLIYLNGGDDLQNVLDRVEAAGGTILRPKAPVSPDHGFSALIEDTEENVIGLHSMQ